MTILRRLGNLLFAYDIVKKYNEDEEYERRCLDPKEFGKMRWKNLQDISDRYKRLGFFPMPLDQSSLSVDQVYLEPTEAFKAEQPFSYKGFPVYVPLIGDPQQWRRNPGLTFEIAELEKPEADQCEHLVSMMHKYARYEPTNKESN